LFKRVTRYSESLSIDPGENRLTESFATVLAEIPSLAADLVERWDGDRPSGPIHIRTQRPTMSGGYVDLELRVNSSTNAESDRRVSERMDSADFGAAGNAGAKQMKELTATHGATWVTPVDRRNAATRS
jgi:hypothetical protein